MVVVAGRTVPRLRRLLGRTGGHVTGGQGPAQEPFDPDSLFAGGELGFLHDFAIVSELRIASDGSGLAPTNGELVGWARSDDPTQRISTQATEASKPTWLTGGILTFDGTADNLLTTLNASAAATIIALVDVPASPAGVIMGRRTGGSTRLAMLFDGTTGQITGHVGSQLGATIIGGPDLRSTTAVVALSYSGTVVKLYANGIEVYSGAQVGVPTGAFGLRIGSGNLNSVAEAFFNGNIRKAFSFNRVATPAEVGRLTNYWEAT